MEFFPFFASKLGGTCTHTFSWARRLLVVRVKITKKIMKDFLTSMYRSLCNATKAILCRGGTMA